MDILSWVIPIPLRNLFVPVLTGGLEKAPHILRFFLLDIKLLFWYINEEFGFSSSSKLP